MGVAPGHAGAEGAFVPWVVPRDDLVWPVRLDPDGVAGPTRNQAKGRRWRRCAQGWHVPADVESTEVEQRILEQAVRVVGTTGAMTGWASLRWRGIAYFDGGRAGSGLLPVPLLRLAGGSRQQQGLAHWSADQLAPSEIEIVRGVPCATVQRSLFDVVRYEPSVWRGTTAIDMTAAAGQLSVALFGEYAAHRPAWTGIPVVRRAILVACDESKSPQETRLRLVWVLVAGLPPPLVNRPVFDSHGTLLGCPDLLDPEAGLVVEYDGADHLEARRRRKDIAREERFRDHGLEYLTVVAGQLRDPDLVASRLHRARRRARFLPDGQRRWTLTAPPWWNEPETLDGRLRRTGQAVALTHT